MAEIIGSQIFTLIPLIVFGGALLAIFIFFILGVLSLFFTDSAKKGEEIILKSLTCLFAFLIIFLVFISVSYLVKKGEIFKPEELAESGFPVSPMGKFPPPPNFIKIGGYSFAGPWLLEEKDEKIDSTVFAVLCKKDKNYDIIDIRLTERRKKISSNPNYSCWRENCGNDLYVAFYWMPSEDFSGSDKKNIINNLKKEINLPCNYE